MKTKLQDGQKLDRQYRNGKLELRAEGIGESERIIKDVSVSSDEPYERYYGTEILRHEPECVNLDRLKQSAAPLLWNHLRDDMIGKLLNPRLENGRLIVDLKFSRSERATQILDDVRDGIVTECSVGYSVDKFEVDEDEETYTASRWTVYEASLVSIPADFSVGVGRSAEALPVSIVRKDLTVPPKNEKAILNDERSTSPKGQNMTRNVSRQLLDADDGATASAGTATAPTLDLKAEQAKWATQNKERIRKIRDHVKEFRHEGMKPKVAELAEKAIEDGTSFVDFRQSILDNWNETSRVDTEDKGGIEVMGERGQKPQAQSIGSLFVNSREVKAVGGRLQRGQSVGLDVPNFSMIGIRGKVAMAQRAGFTSADLSAVNITVAPGILALGVQRLTIMDVIGSGSIGTGAYKYARENSFGTIDGTAVSAGAMPRAKAVGERGVKPSWEPDLTTETATVAKVAITTKVPDEFLADFPSAMSYIDQRLPFMVDTETEFQILYGDGLNNNLEGIFTTAGVQTRAVTTSSDAAVAASLRQGLTDIQVGAQFEPDFFGFHPYDWETASLLKDTTGRFLAGGPFYVPYTNGVYMELRTFWGKPVVVSTAISYGRPIAGAGKLGAAALIREGMRIEMTNANEDDFKRNLICLRAEHRLALPVYRPVAFLEFTGFPARA